MLEIIPQPQQETSEIEKKRAYDVAYRAVNQEWINAKGRARDRLSRLAALNHYGGKCACCGETTYEFLAIDHINGGGNEHRKAIGVGRHIIRWLIKNNYPEGFQVLCHNCNVAKGFHGECPHKRKDNNETTEQIHPQRYND